MLSLYLRNRACTVYKVSAAVERHLGAIISAVVFNCKDCLCDAECSVLAIAKSVVDLKLFNISAVIVLCQY